MSEEETTETTEVPEDQTKDTGKGLRAQLEKKISENADLRTKLLTRSYEELGLDPTKLIGKAIAEKYDGEPSTEALAKFAEAEYGYTPPVTEEQHPQAAQIAQGQAALDQIGQTAGSVADLSQVDVLAKAEAEGDNATSMAIKSQQLAELMHPRR